MRVIQSEPLILPDASATERLGEALAAHLKPGDVLALEGSLGAGKTTLARALIQHRARSQGMPIEEVPSPTFTLVQIYEMPDFALWHFDLYRLGGPDEAWELGIEEAFKSAASLIEWPDRIEPMLPADILHIQIAEPGESGRTATLRGCGGWADRIATAWPVIVAHVG